VKESLTYDHPQLGHSGIFVALALRFDTAQKRGSVYFSSAFAGYVAGLGTTILVMNWFQAAQVSMNRRNTSPYHFLFV
jgi:hypothetical protein